MKKIILLSCFILFKAIITTGQTNATDFNATDCDGNPHHLFSELDAGNIIVISWVMPCSPCATYSLLAYSAVQSFATSHPGKVHFYMADDYANTPCSNLSVWAGSYNMPNTTFFSSSDVNMNGYGTPGMPKVVVLGGASHSIYFNRNDSGITLNRVTTAINDALTFSDINEQKGDFELSSFPNPSNDLLNITCNISQVENITFEILNSLGETVFSVNEKSISTIGTFNKVFDISRLESGIYFLNVSSTSKIESLEFIVSH